MIAALLAFLAAQERLADARANADLVIDTGRYTVEAVVQRVLALARDRARNEQR